MIWFVILTTVMNTGEVYADVRFPNELAYNNEAMCNEAGKAIIELKQSEIGTNAGKVYYICQSVTVETLEKAVTKKTSL
jgi:hypothetical protein